MKKTYIIPTLQVVKIQPAQFIATSIPMEGKDAVGPGMARRARFSDWDEDWDEE